MVIRFRRHTQTPKSGFTLVELLVVAPIVILAIGAFITAIIAMTGEVLASRTANTMTYDLQDALNRIEEDVKLSAGFLSTNSIPFAAGNPQGAGNNGSTTPFTNVNVSGEKSLILNIFATNANPKTPNAGLIYLTNQPNACETAQVVDNVPMTTNVIYYLKDDTLWRRTVMPANYDGGTTIRCSTPWQQPSCQPNYTHAFCKTNDIRLIDGISAADFSVKYFTSAGDTSSESLVASNASATDAARNTALQGTPTVQINLTSKKVAAGRSVERSAGLRATRLDTNATSIAETIVASTPLTPNVTAAVVGGSNVNYSWPAVKDATTYTLRYRINGGGWVAALTDTTQRTFTVTTATHKDTVQAEVTAKNEDGIIGPVASSSTLIPTWAPLTMADAWRNYNEGYSEAGYTITSAGVVVLKGLVTKSSATVANEVIATLPPGYRPAGRLIFGNTTNPNASGRVDIHSNGNVVLSGGDAVWFSLDTIRFVPDGRYTRVTPTLSNGWTHYGGDLAPASYVVDSVGRVVTQGLVAPGTITDGTIIFNLPAALRPAKYQHHATRSAGFAHLGISNTSGVLAKGDASGGYLSLNEIFYPSSVTGWTNLTLVNSWVTYAGSSGTYSLHQYIKGSDGLVSLKGLIKSGSTTSDTIIATLPAGFRPKERLLLTTANSATHNRIDITPTGEIRFQGSTNGWLSLDGITFYADQ